MESKTLTPTLSCKRERGESLLPLAGEGGAKGRMRVSAPIASNRDA
jgi:hypothetical protein